MSDQPNDTAAKTMFGEVLAAILKAPVAPRPEVVAMEANSRAAWEVARMIANRIEVSATDAFNELNISTPRNFTCLLESPEGWAALAEYTGYRFGIPTLAICPTVH